jgi:ABC-type transport system involved in cytochrome c biogenesis permease component
MATVFMRGRMGGMLDKVLTVVVIFILLAIPVAPALLLNLRDDGWQFRFRTLLIGTTLLAVLLALIVCVVGQ